MLSEHENGKSSVVRFRHRNELYRKPKMQSAHRFQEMRFRSERFLNEFDTMSSRMSKLESACRLRQCQVGCEIEDVDV